MKKISEEQIQQIKILREKGLSLNQIALQLSISRDSVTKYSQNITLSKRDKSIIKSKAATKRKYNLQILKNLDNISYYLLGAFMTDGHIIWSNNSYGAFLTSNDKEWLFIIGNLLCDTPSIINSKTSNASTLCLTNIEIAEWFITKGCTPSKSLTLQFPIVPQQYLVDFIRGCWDGDGCLCIYRAKDRKIPRIYSYISSASEEFVKQFQKALLTLDIKSTINKCKLCNSIIRGRPILAKHNLYRLHLSKENTIKLCKLIYQEDKICLNRKQNKAHQILSISIQ